jgi:dihydroorotate dehydrogenase (NAD+) catalytic subunit
MKVTLAGIELANPVIAASGTFGYGIEFEEIVSLERIGGFVTKGISLEPIQGHPAPRLIQTAAGMLNAIGLQNVGVAEFIERKLPPLRRYPACNVIVNVFGYTVADYIGVIDRLNQAEGIAAYEINVSCPNVHAGGMTFGADPGSLEYLVGRARNVSKRPIIVKLSPNVTSISHMAQVAANAGADAVSLVNTFRGLVVNWRKRRPILANDVGGMSGPAIKPLALRIVWEVARALPDLPIIGIGGIANADDALEFLVAGASAIQVGTATFYDPTASERLLDDLTRLVHEENVPRLTDLIGTLRSNRP